MTLKQMVNMKLNEREEVLKETIEVIRVPGGWTYSLWDEKIDGFGLPVFVPLPPLVPMSSGVDYLEKGK